MFYVMLCICIYRPAFAQVFRMDLGGTVVDLRDGKPLAGATVYLDKTTKATSTDEQGRFTLQNLPSGNYRLVVTHLGYESAFVDVRERSAHRFRVELEPRKIILNEVTVQAESRRAEYFPLFSFFFLGNNGKECTVGNPKSLYLHYDNTTYRLSAEAREPLVIENRLLGYRVYYDLQSFSHYPGRTSYSGFTRFEPMKASGSKEERTWAANRKAAYEGSFNHFMRSVAENRFVQEGFIVKRLVKLKETPPNRHVLAGLRGEVIRHPDTLVSMTWTGRDFAPADTGIVADSTKLWGRKQGYQIIYPQRLPKDSIITERYVVGDFHLAFRHSLFVVYTRWKTDINPLAAAGDKQPSYPSSILTMLREHTPIDRQGNLADPNAVIQEGYWATLRVADQLPDDYKPEKE